MHFEPGGLTYNQKLDREVKRMKARRKADANKRKKRLLFDDPEAVVVAQPAEPTRASQSCTVIDCERPRHARGLCSMHNKRDRRARGLKD